MTSNLTILTSNQDEAFYSNRCGSGRYVHESAFLQLNTKVCSASLSTFVAAQNLSASYAPVYVECPAIDWIRPADGMAPAEAAWVYGRKQVVTNSLQDYLLRVNLTGFDVADYICKLVDGNFSSVPTLGMAISGGGYASAYTGTGVMRALDERTPAAVEQKTGGILNSLTYFSGISGGAWPAMSFIMNNWPTADELVPQWKTNVPRLEGVANNTQYAEKPLAMFQDLIAKQNAGFNVSTADYFGRGWGYEFIPGTNGGLDSTMSGVQNLSNFQTFNMPFPIISTLAIDANDKVYYGLRDPDADNAVFEITPFEFGALNGNATGFIPIEYLGTEMYDGQPVNSSACVRGFDRGSFILGASGAAFNFWIIEDKSNGTLAPFSKRSTLEDKVRSLTESFPLSKRTATTQQPQDLSRREPYNGLSKRFSFPAEEIEALITAFDTYLGLNVTEISYAYIPNPFVGLPDVGTQYQTKKTLTFVDGAEAGQAIPLWGMLQTYRNSDFIIAFDDDEDTSPYGWNNGTNLYDTYVQATVQGLPFPVVPPASTFVAYNYTTRPVFFGCDTNLTNTQDASAPIIMYMANAPYSAYTNFTYAQPTTTDAQMQDVLLNSFNMVTQGNGTLDGAEDWAACLACAAIERSLAKVGMQRTEQCEQCFADWCWDGTSVAADADVGIVDPPLLLDPSLGFEVWNQTHDF